MNKIVLALLCVSFLISLPGWSEPPEYGKVSFESLLASVYAQDSTMEAEIICDMGNTYFTYIDNVGFKVVFERRTRIKIYTQQGFDRANVAIPYYIKDNYSAETVKDIEGATYNIENGVIDRREISKKDVYEVDISENWKQKVFALPNVKEGSIIEYKYTVISPFYVHLQDWIFQHTIPARWSEYRVKIPAFFDYQMLRQGFLKFDVEEAKASAMSVQLGPYTYKNAEYLWILKEVPPFRNEKFITTPDDYIAKIEFQLSKEKFPGRHEGNFMSTWDELIRKMLKDTDFGRYYDKTSSEQKERVAVLTGNKANELEKAKALYAHMHSAVRWNGEMRRQPAVQAKKLWETGTGNCTDINLMFVNLLNLAGIEAKPVLLSTRDNGKIFMDYPFLHKFNYTIVYARIDGNDIMLDATDPFLPFGIIPPYCLNGYGLIVDKEQALWAKLESAGIYYQSAQVVMQPDTLHNFTAQITKRYDGFAALEYRKELQNNEAEVGSLRAANEQDLRIQNLEDVDTPLIITYKITTTSKEADLLYLDLFYTDAVKENPFRPATRNFPVDFNYPRIYQYKLNLEIPEGYTVEELPAQVKQVLDDNSVHFTFMAQHIEANNTVQVYSKIAINQSQVEAKQYPSLKQLYDTIVDKHAGLVVLRKIK